MEKMETPGIPSSFGRKSFSVWISQADYDEDLGMSEFSYLIPVERELTEFNATFDRNRVYQDREYPKWSKEIYPELPETKKVIDFRFDALETTSPGKFEVKLFAVGNTYSQAVGTTLLLAVVTIDRFEFAIREHCEHLYKYALNTIKHSRRMRDD